MGQGGWLPRNSCLLQRGGRLHAAGAIGPRRGEGRARAPGDRVGQAVRAARQTLRSRNAAPLGAMSMLRRAYMLFELMARQGRELERKDLVLRLDMPEQVATNVIGRLKAAKCIV